MLTHQRNNPAHQQNANERGKLQMMELRAVSSTIINNGTFCLFDEPWN